ncbi:MAG: hypothetical protein A2Y14_00645 [Verrucomicrobia bacterium GWF2_51_19]|nr:MAG: hypothetical protein A2Y14_00645 [Verrucomicrobia bacterium GWF2_51_19]HCJ12429.1 hypothetical protein [Opitutae bacterium]
MRLFLPLLFCSTLFGGSFPEETRKLPRDYWASTESTNTDDLWSKYASLFKERGFFEKPDSIKMQIGACEDWAWVLCYVTIGETTTWFVAALEDSPLRCIDGESFLYLEKGEQQVYWIPLPLVFSEEKRSVYWQSSLFNFQENTKKHYSPIQDIPCLRLSKHKRTIFIFCGLLDSRTIWICVKCPYCFQEETMKKSLSVGDLPNKN